MKVELTWFGVSTYRLQVGDSTIFLDAFVDRAASAPPVGLLSKEVERADAILVGHAHFDHLLGAETIAVNTGADVYGSYESVRMLAGEGVAETQLTPVSGGEAIQIGEHVRVRVYPGLHSCTWADRPENPEECLEGDVGLSLQDRQARVTDFIAADRLPQAAHGRGDIRRPRGDGGALAFLIETPEGSIWWNDTSGYWSWALGNVHPDVALLAAVGRGNVDGEPVQGSIAQFVGAQAELLRPSRVLLCHHDNWNPPYTYDWDMRPVHDEVRSRAGSFVDIADVGYSDPVPLFSHI